MTNTTSLHDDVANELRAMISKVILDRIWQDIPSETGDEYRHINHAYLFGSAREGGDGDELDWDANYSADWNLNWSKNQSTTSSYALDSADYMLEHGSCWVQAVYENWESWNEDDGCEVVYESRFELTFAEAMEAWSEM